MERALSRVQAEKAANNAPWLIRPVWRARSPKSKFWSPLTLDIDRALGGRTKNRDEEGGRETLVAAFLICRTELLDYRMSPIAIPSIVGGTPHGGFMPGVEQGGCVGG